MRDIPTTSIDISHHLQRQILLQLRKASDQTYQQLKPDGVEGNAYNYHLKNLKKAGLITAEDGAYQLTPTGHVVADAFSGDAGRLVLRPHQYTYLLVTSKDQVLLYEPTREPLPGVHCLPSGKLHYGDDFPASIARELKRRDLTLDYTASNLCPINIRYVQDDHIVLQRPGQLWHVAYNGPLNESTTPNGHAAWYSISDLANVTALTAEVLPGITRLNDASHEPIDLEVTL